MKKFKTIDYVIVAMVIALAGSIVGAIVKFGSFKSTAKAYPRIEKSLCGDVWVIQTKENPTEYVGESGWEIHMYDAGLHDNSIFDHTATDTLTYVNSGGEIRWSDSTEAARYLAKMLWKRKIQYAKDNLKHFTDSIYKCEHTYQ